MTEALEERVETAYPGKPFGIEPPSQEYDRKTFVEAMNIRKDVKEAYEKAKESHNTDVSALRDLAAYSTLYHAGEVDPTKGRREWEMAFQSLWGIWSKHPTVELDFVQSVLLDPGDRRIAKYVERNRKTMLNELSEEKLYEIWTRLPLYETGDKKLDEAIALRNKIMNLQKAKNEAEIEEIIQPEIDALIERVPEEQRMYLFSHADLVFGGIKRGVIRGLQEEFSARFRDEKGNLDKRELIKAIEKNYDAVRDFIEDNVPQADAKSINDLWEKNIEPWDITIAETLYRPEKEAQKEKDNPTKAAWEKKAGQLRIAA